MSQENVEALKRAVDANNRRDYEALLEEFDPDVEWHGIFGLMFGKEATVVRGHEGLLGYVRDLDEVRHAFGPSCAAAADRLGPHASVGTAWGTGSVRDRPRTLTDACVVP